jgi:hypothetical protein
VAFEVDEGGYVVLCGESGEGVSLVSEDSLLDVAGHPDIKHTPLAAQNVDVVSLGHLSRLQI